MQCGEIGLLPAARNADTSALIIANRFSCKTQLEESSVGREAAAADIGEGCKECRHDRRRQCSRLGCLQSIRQVRSATPRWPPGPHGTGRSTAIACEQFSDCE